MKVPHDLEKAISSLPADFFGTIEITFQNGEPAILKTTTTTKFNASRERGNRANANPERQ